MTIDYWGNNTKDLFSKKLLDLPLYHVDIVILMKVGGDMECLCMMFDHIKSLKDGPPLCLICMIANIVRC